MNMKCPKCGYEWESKVPNPKECPRCKGRLDYVPGPVGAPKVWKKKEVGKEMTSKKLPLVAAAIIIVAAVGAWAILGGTPVTPSAGGWTSTSVLGFTGGQKSGIVAVYIAKLGQDYSENWSAVANQDNYYLKQTASGQSGDIPYETPFVILVEVVGHDDNMAYINLENLKVELGITGSFTKTAENTDGGDGTEYQFAISPTEIGVNAVWDNNGNGFKLPANGSITYTTKLWLWG